MSGGLGGASGAGETELQLQRRRIGSRVKLLKRKLEEVLPFCRPTSPADMLCQIIGKLACLKNLTILSSCVKLSRCKTQPEAIFHRTARP